MSRRRKEDSSAERQRKAGGATSKVRRRVPFWPEGREARIWMLVLFLASVVVYFPSWRGEFLWDDNTGVIMSEIIHDPGGWWKAWLAPPQSHPDYFPLTTNSFWIERRFFGENPLGYRLVNTLLHGAVVLLLFALLRYLALPAAGWAALLYALHPVNVESVAWISERKNLLCMVLAIPAFHHFIRWETTRSPGNYKWALALFFGSVAAKASVVALPLVFLAYLWSRDRRLDMKVVRAVVPFLLASLVFGLLVIHFQHGRAVGGWEIEMPGWLSRIGGAATAYWHYVGKALWPVNLATIYPRWTIDPPQAWQLALAAVTAVLAAVFLLGRNPTLRTVGFGMVASTLLLAPTLGFIKMSFMRYALVSDHFQHVALPLLVAVSVCGVAHLVTRSRLPVSARRGLQAVPVLLACALFALSWQRAGIHASNEAMWRDSLTKNPDSSQAHNFLGSILAARKEFDEAQKHFLEAARLDPNDPQPLTNYAYTLLDRGRAEESVPWFWKAVQAGDWYAGAYFGLSEAHQKLGDERKALDVLISGAESNPDSMTLNAAAGGGLLLAGRAREAILFLEQCRSLDPDNPQLLADLARARQEAAEQGKSIPSPPEQNEAIIEH